jgi:hypothetical protein
LKKKNFLNWFKHISFFSPVLLPFIHFKTDKSMRELFFSAIMLAGLMLGCCFSVKGQDSKPPAKVAYGFESELMTWINSGYHGSFWIGKNGHRFRAIVARATFPSQFTPEGFRDLTSQFYEVETDHFFGKNRAQFRGFWLAIGAGYTKQSIVEQTSHMKKAVDLIDIHSGAGYAINIYKGMYINPWLGIDYHVNAPDAVPVGNRVWKPGTVDPVFGAKIGYSLR